MDNIIQGSGGGGGCFRKGTLIQQDNGKVVPIEELSVGDTVLAFDENGVLYNSKVTAVHFHEKPEPLIRVKFWKGSIDITSNHWVLNQYCSFMEMGKLSTEDALVDGLGHLRPIISFEKIEAESVYNLTVEPHHTFIANGIRVHNGGFRNTNPIAGSGGGGGGKGGGGSAHVPTEAPDSLHSKQYAKVIDLVCEGEIEGLVNGLNSVYLDNTPIQTEDGINNFTGITISNRNGTQSQSYIEGFQEVQAEIAVSTEVKSTLPVVRTISTSNLNAINITIGVPGLTYQNPSTGDMSGSSVNLQIYLNTAGGGFVLVKDDTISGKTTTRYQRSYRIPVSGLGPWDIKVVKVTADSTSAALRNNIYWESYTEVIDTKLSYPNSAIVALQVDSSQFNSVPSRGYDIKGLKVRIPSNYNPSTRSYTGVWNGTFTYAWTDNPAWCFFDLITNDRYGLGTFIDESQVDKWSLYTIAKYCDELVPNGFGGLEPRFTCNLYLQTREEAFKVVNSMASIFRGMVFWGSGSIIPVQDAPSDPVASFTAANVINGQFNYQGSSIKARHTVVLVSWNDPADLYKQKIEYVEDADGIAKYGVIQSDMLAVGCTSRGQAHRLGKWVLYTEKLESETITFRTGIEGAILNPGNIIITSDPTRAGTRMGGRLVSSSSNTLTLDSSIYFQSGKSYTIWITLPDKSISSHTVVNLPGTTTNIVQIADNLSTLPMNDSIWVLSSSDVVPEKWRVISVTEVDNTQAEISALSYRSDKYSIVEDNLILEPLQTSSLDPNKLPDTPTDIHVIENLYMVTSSIVGTRITISWFGNSPYYEVKYRKANENWTVRTSLASSIDIQPVDAGVYEFNITALNAIGKRSVPATNTTTIYGLSIPPKDVTGFAINVISNNAHLSWDASTDLDVIVSGALRIRYTPDTVTPNWSNAIDIGSKLAGSSTSAVLPLLAGTYLAKWVDSSGNESVNATSIITDSVNIFNMNFIANLDQHPTFAGAKTNTFAGPDGLVLDSASLVDSMTALVDTWPNISIIGGVAPTGDYLFTNYIDLGSVQTSRLYATIQTLAYDTSDLIDERNLSDTWPVIDGGVISDVGCMLYLRTTNDDPAGTPTWSAWQPFMVGDWNARAFQFKLEMFSNYSTHNLAITQLSVSVDMPDRVQSGNNIVSGAATYHVTYPDPFMGLPALGISAENMSTGDYYQITNKTLTGFDIIFKNSAGTTISRTFDYIARGY